MLCHEGSLPLSEAGAWSHLMYVSASHSPICLGMIVFFEQLLVVRRLSQDLHGCACNSLVEHEASRQSLKTLLYLCALAAL